MTVKVVFYLALEVVECKQIVAEVVEKLILLEYSFFLKSSCILLLYGLVSHLLSGNSIILGSYRIVFKLLLKLTVILFVWTYYCDFIFRFATLGRRLHLANKNYEQKESLHDCEQRRELDNSPNIRKLGVSAIKFFTF